jgi:serine/threonine-protein kinase
MATVYLATDLRLERRVAIKVMHHHLSDDDRFQARFIQEARAAARLSDPHVVSVFDQGQDDDVAYLVMEHLPGVTLRDLINETGRLSLEHTITVMHAVLAGLASAHEAGYIHRDVKPENVLIAEDGRIKIGDFGLARATSANTATGQQLLGTIAYLAPELMKPGTADARADVYAIGIMLYEMLTGEQPYRGEQPLQIAYQHATESVPRPSIKNPEVPEQLDELVLWSTERDPEERPSDAGVLLERLREIESQLGIQPIVPQGRVRTNAEFEEEPDDGETALLPPSMDTGRITSVLPGTVTADEGSSPASDGNAERLRVKTRRRRVRGWWAAVMTIVLAVTAGGTGWWFGSGPGSMVPVPVFATTTPYADVAVQLRDLELVPEHETENSLTVAEGRILSVSPEPGTRVYPGDTVTVTTSLGPAEVSIVRLRGMTREQVAQYAEDAVLTLGDDAPQNYDSRDAGTVIGARVSKEAGGEGYGCLDGCNAYQGYTLTLTTSAGPVPEVAGVSADEARSRLSDAGLEVAEENTLEYSDTVAEGVTIRYDVADPEAALHPGDTVTIVESQGPQPVPVPEIPEGTTLPDAIAILEDAGLTASYDTGKWSAFLNAGLGGFVVVQSTSPAAGESVLPGSTVTLNAKLANLID